MGRIIYTPTSFLDILPDHYKHKPISIYNPRKAPILNTYRLTVPRIRNLIEIFQFIVLLVSADLPSPTLSKIVGLLTKT